MACQLLFVCLHQKFSQLLIFCVIQLTRNIFGYIFELWEVNNAGFSDCLKQHDAAAAVTFCDRAYLCLKGLFIVFVDICSVR